MTGAVQHALLGLALAALAGASLRVAGATGARGLEQVLAAAPLAAAAAAVQALALGLFGLGGSSVALSVAALISWGAARWALPEAARPLAGLAEWWRASSGVQRVAAGALVAVSAAYVLFLLRFPAIGRDGLHYHLPDVAGWVHSGHTGAATDYFDDLPTGSYPLTNEVLIGWATGLSHGLTAVTLWPAACLVGLAAGCARGLRGVGATPAVSALATAALVSSPLVLGQTPSPSTDLAAAAWVAVAAALCTGLPRHPRLAAPMLVALGLAVGSKTTAAAPALLLAVAAWVVLRPSLRRPPLWLTAGGLLAVLVGAPWYVRNLIDHGSPLWPLAAGPSGDPVPPVLAQVDGRLISDLGSLAGRADHYATVLAGTVVLAVAALAAPLVARRRPVVLAGGAFAACTLVWLCAPYTGYPRGPEFDSLAVGAVRYLLPALMAAIVVLALAARERGLARVAALAALVAALGLNVGRDAALGFPYLPSAAYLLGAAGLGGAAGWVLGGRGRFFPAPRAVLGGRGRFFPAPRAATGLAAVLTAALLTVPAGGYVRRHMAVTQVAEPSARWISERPGFAGGDRPVFAVGTVNGALAGDRLRHPVGLLPRGESCARLRSRVRSGWVVLPQPGSGGPGFVLPGDSLRRHARLRRCLAGVRPAFEDERHQVYGRG